MRVLHRENNPCMRHTQILLFLEGSRAALGSFTPGLPSSASGMGSIGAARLVMGHLRL